MYMDCTVTYAIHCLLPNRNCPIISMLRGVKETDGPTMQSGG